MHYDVAIVGGSFAGLSAALQIARGKRKVVVVDAGLPRNRFASHSHGFLTRDGSVPGDMLDDLGKAKIVITNFHAFKLRERLELSKGGRALLQGRGGNELNTEETEGQMLQRVMPDLMGLKNILVLNDEVADGNKTVEIELSNPGGGGALGAQATSVLWIVDWP